MATTNIPRLNDWEQLLTVSLCQFLYDANLLLHRAEQRLPPRDFEKRMKPLMSALRAIEPEVRGLEAASRNDNGASLEPAIMYLKDAMAHVSSQVP